MAWCGKWAWRWIGFILRVSPQVLYSLRGWVGYSHVPSISFIYFNKRNFIIRVIYDFIYFIRFYFEICTYTLILVHCNGCMDKFPSLIKRSFYLLLFLSVSRELFGCTRVGNFPYKKPTEAVLNKRRRRKSLLSPMFPASYIALSLDTSWLW